MSMRITSALASMRPRLKAAENNNEVAARVWDDDASMRPRLKAAENVAEQGDKGMALEELQ